MEIRLDIIDVEKMLRKSGILDDETGVCGMSLIRGVNAKLCIRTSMRSMVNKNED